MNFTPVIRSGNSPTRRDSFLLESTLALPRSIDAVFTFFADAHNLERITPPFLKFQVRTPRPIDMRKGVLIDYRIRLHGIPIGWQSEITHWDPPHRFVDEQRRGPYRYWRHEHIFEARQTETLVRDEVTYAVPGGRLINRLFVARDLERIFRFRGEALAKIFGEPQEESRASSPGGAEK